jgi:hypothetical protein
MIQIVLFILAIALFILAAFVSAVGRAAVLPLAFAATVAAFAWPVIAAHG